MKYIPYLKSLPTYLNTLAKYTLAKHLAGASQSELSITQDSRAQGVDDTSWIEAASRGYTVS